MNIYDTKQIRCYRCKKFIGEVDYDAEVVCPKCGDCSDPFPKGDDIGYAVSAFVRKHQTH